MAQISEVELPKLARLIAEFLRDELSPQEVMTPKQAAKYLQYGDKMLELMRHAGNGPRFSQPGRFVRYKKKDLDDWLANASRTNSGRAA